MTPDPIDLHALRARLREYDPTVSRCKGTILKEQDFSPDYASEEGRAEWRMTFRHPCGRPEGHDGDCRSGRPVLGWPGHAALTALLDEVAHLRARIEDLKDGYAFAREKATALERQAVVAWLRGEPERLVQCDGHRHADGNPCLVMSPMPADELADAIERGEHRRGEER